MGQKYPTNWNRKNIWSTRIVIALEWTGNTDHRTFTNEKGNSLCMKSVDFGGSVREGWVHVMWAMVMWSGTRCYTAKSEQVWCDSFHSPLHIAAHIFHQEYQHTIDLSFCSITIRSISAACCQNNVLARYTVSSFLLFKIKSIFTTCSMMHWRLTVNGLKIHTKK